MSVTTGGVSFYERHDTAWTGRVELKKQRSYASSVRMYKKESFKRAFLIPKKLQHVIHEQDC